ncbi:unnamed protein product [Cylindrotheca closterium]|uniref:Immune mapped protein 2 N-terminal domain-containing protein n=1 Tax=Cylindrotheca closterium TaxID=2856 RepID=A0AAD2G3D2_9STRA|nr:unnamed protein product [Cylindrotheca closterium]
MPEFATEEGPEGCYLMFDTLSGGRLLLYYSRGKIPLNAIGFWCPGPGKAIQGFKFKQSSQELIKGIAGGDQNRKKYFSGWCQFIKQAKAMGGYVIKFPNAEQGGVEVDIIGFRKESEEPIELDLEEGLIEVADLDAISVVPKHNPTFRGIKTIVESNFLDMGNLAGAAINI